MSSTVQPYDPSLLVAHAAAVAALPRYERAGYLLDVLLCVIFMNGDGVETMSHLSAREDVAGVWWACRLCRVLSIVVERDHCRKTLAQGDTSRAAMWRAGTAMVVLLIFLGGLADLTLRALVALLFLL